MTPALPHTPPREALPDWVFVVAGALVGTLARAGLDALAGLWPAPGAHALSWSTVVVNLSGALFLGGVAGAFSRLGVPSPAQVRLRLFLATGFAGSFTTYSTFVLAGTRGMEGADLGVTVGRAAGESLLTLVLGVVAAAFGWYVVRALRPRSREGGGAS